MGRLLLAAALAAGAAAAWLARPDPPLHLAPRVVVITGATGGLGRAAAEAFAARGDRVFACGRSEAGLAALRKLPNTTALRCDVSSEGSIGEFAGAVLAELDGEPVDVLVNNAGVLLIGHPLLAARTQAFDQSWGVNVRGAFLVTRALVPSMRPRPGVPAPVIINLGSTTETPKLAQAFHGMYQMSKVALRAFSTGIRQEAELLGIRVVHIRAGAFDSDLHHAFDTAGDTIRGYGGWAARFADTAQRFFTENLKMVTSAPVHDLAMLLWSIAHSEHPRDGYDYNVSFLEKLVEWLPQHLLDSHVRDTYATVPH